MEKRYPPFVEAVKPTDSELYEVVTKNMDIAMGPGELDMKTKALIALALDALEGSTEGVKSVAGMARGLGASEGEIKEALRIAYMVAANKALAATRGAY
ncbi:alkylhydroperoxidase/carboxymuconolactone decarboxylase family protein YurZ [Anaerosolibacter carboniphilus]|uniref:Alkylhydroperoxidase/carboxymuconolactone decarboxylase family protein YurZ n=1 Tax=Anaerosolibacter carboniphilus TaxID=1417629 RepID=A0A841L9E0_9FIRM|nr:carboxymuconolactone decarboxylase family protein [Anaerosolibacter carboniphilus]MBB6218989.1 alkylhydroperoxidase/carboxymuconolactone decarboxylase family protein YurZ [Anaerosolibacter carboniphilus]